MLRAALTFLAGLAFAASAQAAAPEKIRVGYWTSGFSVGFGAVLEAERFLEKRGLAPEYIRFSDVNGPTKALLTHSIDVAFAAPATGAFTLGIQGAPVQIVDLDELGEDTVDCLHCLRHHDRGTERGHGAGDIDDAAQAELRTDVGSVGGHGGDL